MQRRRIVGSGVALAVAVAAGVTASVMTLPAIADDREQSGVAGGRAPRM